MGICCRQPKFCLYMEQGLHARMHPQCTAYADAHTLPCRTIADHVKFTPYGKSVDNNPERIQYMINMKGYCKIRLLPCFDIYEAEMGSLPKHLKEVTPPAMHACASPSRIFGGFSRMTQCYSFLMYHASNESSPLLGDRAFRASHSIDNVHLE